MGYGVFYYRRWNKESTRKVPVIEVSPVIGLFLHHSPSGCTMFIPGTYAEMMKDYG